LKKIGKICSSLYYAGGKTSPSPFLQRGKMGKSQEALKCAFDSQKKNLIRPRVLGGGNLNLVRVNSARDNNKNCAFMQNKRGCITKRSQEAGSKT
jgi:hypothetical protein